MELTPDIQAQFALALRINFRRQTSQMTDRQLFDLIHSGYQNACELDIRQYYNVYRFIALRLLPAPVLASQRLQAVIARILNNFDLTESQKLSFIYKHIVDGRMHQDQESKA